MVRFVQNDALRRWRKTYCTVSRGHESNHNIISIYGVAEVSRDLEDDAVSKFPSLLGSSKLKYRTVGLATIAYKPFYSDLAQAVMRFFEQFGLILSNY
jgi:hypothetical protein